MASERYYAALRAAQADVRARERQRLSRHYVRGHHWAWTGTTQQCGVSPEMGWYPYGIVRRAGKAYLAHRAVWEAHKGPIPAGERLVNVCGATTCVNPNHWRLGSHDRS